MKITYIPYTLQYIEITSQCYRTYIQGTEYTSRDKKYTSQDIEQTLQDCRIYITRNRTYIPRY